MPVGQSNGETSSRDVVTRYDASHKIAARRDEVAAPAASLLSATASLDPQANAVHLRAQASQLASHLRERERELDQREAQLNARVADLENELRASRLWFHEREVEFQDRERELQRQVDELSQRLGKESPESSGTASVPIEPPTQDLQAPPGEAERRLAHQLNAIGEMTERLERRAATLRRHRKELQAWLTARHVELEKQAAHLSARESELRNDQLRVQLLQKQCYIERRHLG